jgi:hypothetical protein
MAVLGNYFHRILAASNPFSEECLRFIKSRNKNWFAQNSASAVFIIFAGYNYSCEFFSLDKLMIDYEIKS